MTISTSDVRTWLGALATKLAEHQDLLDALDAGAGDGDHGATMVIGFRRVQSVVSQDYNTPAQLLKAAGRAFAGVGGSIGPLWGMGLLRASQAIEGQAHLDGPAIARALAAAAQAAAEIGHASAGDRTLLDAAIPAAEAFGVAIARGSDSTPAAEAGWRAALEGAAATAAMKAARGRASRNPALAEGTVDPGCASIALAWTVAVCPQDEQRWADTVSGPARADQGPAVDPRSASGKVSVTRKVTGARPRMSPIQAGVILRPGNGDVQTTAPTADDRRLYERAMQLQPASYSPYSGFRVGAAVEADDGRVFAGANMSNASYPVSACAEQAAVSAAVSAGARTIIRAAVAGDSDSLSPCGKCRQLLAEFAVPETTVTYRWRGQLVSRRLAHLLPHSFELPGR